MRTTCVIAAVFVLLGYGADLRAQVVVVPPVVVVRAPPVVVVPAVVPCAPQAVTLAAPAVYPIESVRRRGFGLGLRGGAGFLGVHGAGVWGGGFVGRFIASERFGLELTVEGLTSENARQVAVPLSLNALWFFRTHRRVQPYVLLGAIMTVLVEEQGDIDGSYLYGGGQTGVGIEFLVGRFVGVTLDMRGFVQGGDSSHAPVETGFTLNTGIHFYI